MKIFYNSSELSLQMNAEITTHTPASEAFQSLIHSQSKILYFKNEADLLLFFYEFMTFTTVIPAAGGIVNYQGKYLWMKRRGIWDLPKGKIDTGENPKQAALREVAEETGLSQIRLSEFIGMTWHIYFHKEKWVLKPTYWYAMEALEIGGLKAQKEEDIEELIWANEAEAEELETFSSIREIWKQKNSIF